MPKSITILTGLMVACITALVGGSVGIGYFIFFELGGYVTFVSGTAMTIVSSLAITLSFSAYFKKSANKHIQNTSSNPLKTC